MKKPYITVITEDWGGDGIHSNTYRVMDVNYTKKVKSDEVFSYSELLKLTRRGIDFEILDEDDPNDYR